MPSKRRSTAGQSSAQMGRGGEEEAEQQHAPVTRARTTVARKATSVSSSLRKSRNDGNRNGLRPIFGA